MRVAAVVGGAVSLLLAVGVGTALVQANGSDEGDALDDGMVTGGPDDLTEQLWRTSPLPEGDSDVLSSVTDGQVWLAGGVVVALSGAGVWGHDPDSGEQLWRLAHPDGGDLAPCAASPDVNDRGIGAVLYRRGGGCSALAAVDTASGAVVWTADLAAGVGGGGGAGVGEEEDPSVTVGDGVVAADVGAATHVRRFDIDSGAEQPPPEGCEDADDGGAAFATDHTTRYLVTFADCDGNRRPEATVFDTETAARLWSLPLEPDRRNGNEVTLVAGDPLTFAVRGGDPADDVLRTYDDRGEVLGEIPLGGPDGTAVSATTYHVTPAVVITRSSNTDGITPHRGFDPATGEELWERRLSSRWRLLGEMDEEALVSYEATTGEGLTYAHLARLDPLNGTLHDHVVLPPNPEMSCCPPRPKDVVWNDQGDTLYAIEWHVADGLRLAALRHRH